MSEPMEEQHTYPMKQSATFAGSTLITMGLVDLVAHLGPTGLLVGGLASYVAWKHGPELYGYVRKRLSSSHLPVSQAEQEEQQPRRSGRSFLDRALGQYPDDQEEEDLAQPKEAEDSSTRHPSEEDSQPFPKGTPELDASARQPSSIPAQFGIGAKTLEAIKQVNGKRFVYFGRTATREVVINVDDMYHVLDVASSGKGKSNRFRLAMMQVVELAETYFINPLANPVKAVHDDRKIEVWQPIFDRLANKKPVKEGPEISRLMTALVTEISKRRNQESRRDFSWRKRPIFVFIDELPEVFALCPDAVELSNKIGRMGRQFCVFAWVASQTALVDDIGLSTAAQGQFKTRIYGGGDKTSSDRVMKGSLSREDERILQTNKEGLTLILADGFSDKEFVRAPLVSNESLFAYFGLTYRIEDWITPVSQPPSQRSDNLLDSDLSPFTPGTSQAQNDVVKGVKDLQRERVKGPNEEAILDALNALEEEEKPLTLNAISRKAGLTWRQAEEIEEAAYWFGYELERGKGRPAKEA
jgi:hypothetical protein